MPNDDRHPLLADLPDGLALDEFGAPSEVYKSSNTKMLMIAWLGVAFLVVAVILPIAFLLPSRAEHMNDPDARFLFMIAAPGALAFFGLIMILFGFLNLRSKAVVVVFQHGFVHCVKGNVTMVPWTQIDSVWEALTTVIHNHGAYTVYHFTIQLRDGRTLAFKSDVETEVAGVDRLGARIQKAVTSLQMPKAQERIQSGERIKFGPAEISQNGLRLFKQSFPWREIEGVRTEQGSLIILPKSDGYTPGNVSLAEIPNLHVFLGIVESMVGK